MAKTTKKSMKKLFILIILFALFIPVLTKAAGLVPCGRSEDDPSTPMINEAAPCTACDLLVLFQNVLKFALEIAFLIVVGFIIYGGFRWIFSSGNEANIKAGQQTITNALVGLAIILCAWLIVNTIFWLIKTIGGTDYTGSGAVPWFQLECTYPESNLNINNGNNVINNAENVGGVGNVGNVGNSNQQGKTGNSCSDLVGGYTCIKKITDCADTSLVFVFKPSMYCPDEMPVCCIPSDESKIVANPNNPQSSNPSTGPCQDGKSMEICNYSICISKGGCLTHPGIPTCEGGTREGVWCPEACPHECDSTHPCPST